MTNKNSEWYESKNKSVKKEAQGYSQWEYRAEGSRNFATFFQSDDNFPTLWLTGARFHGSFDPGFGETAS